MMIPVGRDRPIVNWVGLQAVAPPKSPVDSVDLSASCQSNAVDVLFTVSENQKMESGQTRSVSQ